MAERLFFELGVPALTVLGCWAVCHHLRARLRGRKLRRITARLLE